MELGARHRSIGRRNPRWTSVPASDWLPHASGNHYCDLHPRLTTQPISGCRREIRRFDRKPGIEAFDLQGVSFPQI